MDKRTTRAPLFLTIALLLLTIYVGSYLALVKPIRALRAVPRSPGAGEVFPPSADRVEQKWFVYPIVRQFGSDRPLNMFYRPLELLDARIRPDSWWWEPRKNGFR